MENTKTKKSSYIAQAVNSPSGRVILDKTPSRWWQGRLESAGGKKLEGMKMAVNRSSGCGVWPKMLLKLLCCVRWRCVVWCVGWCAAAGFGIRGMRRPSMNVASRWVRVARQLCPGLGPLHTGLHSRHTPWNLGSAHPHMILSTSFDPQVESHGKYPPMDEGRGTAMREHIPRVRWCWMEAAAPPQVLL